MAMRGENWRFWLPVAALAVFAAFVSQKLVRSHVDADVTAPRYEFESKLPGRRGSIYDASGETYPLVKSIPVWEYHLDPVALTNAVVRKRGEPRRKPAAIVRTIADALGLDYRAVKAMAANTSKRYQFLAQSTDPEAHRVLADSHLVAGVAIEDRQIRQYLHGRFLSHVLGSVNTQGDASAGLELKFDKELSGVPGLVRGKRDAHGRELYDKRIERVAPVPGADIHLTIDHNLQYEVETGLADGLREFHAGSGWCVILDARTAAVLAMASLPDFHPLAYGKATESARVNRVTGYTYEPGSVMKVVTAAAGIDTGRVRPDSLYSTDRHEDGYYRLPGDGSHVWEPRMSVRDAIVHSSNIVMGKLGFDLGQRVLSDYFKAFGFGSRTGVELPGEECGILPRPIRGTTDWDLATRSRAPIGQAISVTAIQLASAYQAIANDGVRMKPHLVESIIEADGTERYRCRPEALGRPVKAETARTLREMMLGVAANGGTARRAAIRGYSIAGKTGTAQKSAGRRGYIPGLYRATFCGIVPSGVVKRHPDDVEPVPPRIVVLVTLDFDTKEKFHQGGNSAGPVFKRIATAALRYLAVEPDRPEEVSEGVEDEFDQIMDSRSEVVEPDRDFND